MHQLDMVIDLQYGSTGKGLIAGYLAKRNKYDTAVCSFAPNAGHTYRDRGGDVHIMTQQLPTAIVSPTVKRVFLGPGALIHVETLGREMERYADLMAGKELIIHPHAAIVTDEHAQCEKERKMTRIGSTTKGVGEAMMERIARNPFGGNVAKNQLDWIQNHVAVSPEEYVKLLQESESCIVEGAQGFGLSMYHGFYPYTTSRDVTPWQIAADCGIPFRWASRIHVIGTLRTFPIRVNNRDGSSGPGYPDQEEISWEQIGVEPELTTVTKLPRRIFTFSHEQLDAALRMCGEYWKTSIFLNFANYMKSPDDVDALIGKIETPRDGNWNPPRVDWIGVGPDDSNVIPRDQWYGQPIPAESEGGEI